MEKNKEPTLDNVLATGIHQNVLITKEDPEGGFPGMAKKFNLHVGEPYRIIIAGSNPMDQTTFDGVMTELAVIVDPTGFSLKKLVLEQGMTWDEHSAKRPFEKEDFTGPNRS